MNYKAWQNLIWFRKRAVYGWMYGNYGAGHQAWLFKEELLQFKREARV